ncbi:MAG TPA: S41 family peptidase, partial [Anaerolineales bacterium]|nr:S41 family peptidase [Anaerolineales bacterium]
GQVVLNPFLGSPAFEAGVLEGDILLMVNNEVLSPDISIDTITAWLRGPVGEKVEIVISRGDAGNQHEFVISRVEFPLPSVTWHLDFEDPGIGLITINIIAASTKDELIKAVEDLKSRGASGFILDLRENSGGLLTAGIDIARLFLEKGVVIEEQYRNKSVETYFVEKPGPYIDFPLVVMINHNTASAAEIIAGAVKRQGRAVVVGSPSMGKDSIQLVFELKDGSSLHVTAANWWIPGLQPVLGEVGLQPDVTIAGNDPLSEYDVAIAEARKILKQQLAP